MIPAVIATRGVVALSTLLPTLNGKNRATWIRKVENQMTFTNASHRYPQMRKRSFNVVERRLILWGRVTGGVV